MEGSGDDGVKKEGSPPGSLAKSGNDEAASDNEPPPSEPSSGFDGDAAKENTFAQPVVKKVVPPTIPIDWTRMNKCDGEQSPADAIRYPWDVVIIDPNEPYCEVVGTAGMKITRMGSDLQSHISPDTTDIVLRSHLIRKMEGIKGLKKLELLELYDNMVDSLSIDELGGDEEGYPGKNLRVLDISYNVIRDMSPVSLCPNLQELYIAQNKLKAISGIKHLKLLRKLDIGANRIRVIPSEELSGLQNLEELWLGKNKIEKIDGLENLTKLRRLDVQSNRLTTVDNLHAQVDTLEELYLAHNGITVEGATVESGLALKFTQLNTLDLSSNRLTDASPLSHLTSLTDLWISSNDIKTFDDVQPLESLTNLDGIYLEHNPVASDFEYRMQLTKIIPSLTQIDANMIGCVPTFDRGPAVMDKLKKMQERALEKAAAIDETAAALRDGDDEKMCQES
mmetsp:Transcript_35196/g.80409  ORF Transcript_35196/g.80409 Transcript_35196/m.80409 type:complete len:451 (-) Transcript_35196:6302-7654(-)